MIEYADIWVFPDRIEVRRSGKVVETVPVEHPASEGWGEFVMARVGPRGA